MEANATSAPQSVRWFSHKLSVVALALMLGAAGVGIGLYASALAQGNATPVGSVATDAANHCPVELHGTNAAPWVRAELYFGTSGDEAAFETFLNAEITPRFPEGFTLLSGLGQYEIGDTIVQTSSKLLIVLYPPGTARESSAKLEEIRQAYERQFTLEPVLRADIQNVCTSF